jgi:hypothetical protein
MASGSSDQKAASNARVVQSLLVIELTLPTEYANPIKMPTNASLGREVTILIGVTTGIFSVIPATGKVFAAWRNILNYAHFLNIPT